MIGSVAFGLVAIFMRERPPTPPSSTKSVPDLSFKEDIKAVFRNKNALKLVFVFGIIIGLMDTLGTIIGILTAALEYGPGETSMFGAVWIIGGIIGCLAFGVIV